jgi:hypothetical protein
VDDGHAGGFRVRLHAEQFGQIARGHISKKDTIGGCLGRVVEHLFTRKHWLYDHDGRPVEEI